MDRYMILGNSRQADVLLPPNTCHQTHINAVSAPTLFLSYHRLDCHLISSSVHILRPLKMSATQKVQQHPAFVQAQNKANYYIQQLDKELTKYPVLNTFEQRTQIPKTYFVSGSVLLLALFHFVNPLAAPVSNLVGWALPCYLSFKALESPGHQDDVQWLTYWVVFGFFNFLESIALRMVLYYFPWYFAFKTVFILWLQLPTFRGAQTTYTVVLKPVMSNLSGSRAVAPTDTVTAEGLRDRVASANSE